MKRVRSVDDINTNSTPIDREELRNAAASSQPKSKRSRTKQKVSATQANVVVNPSQEPINNGIETHPDNGCNPLSLNSASRELELLNEIKSQRQTIQTLEGSIRLLFDKVDRIGKFIGISESLDISIEKRNVQRVVTGDLQNNDQPAGPVDTQQNQYEKLSQSLQPPLQPPVELNDRPNGNKSAVPRTLSSAGEVNSGPPQLTITDLILNAVHADNSDRERRSKNIIVSGMKESSEDNDVADIVSLLRTEFRYDPANVSCQRLGHVNTNKLRPIKLHFPTSDEASWVLSKAKQLRNSRDPWVRNNVFFNRDLPLAERKAAFEARRLRRELSVSHQSTSVPEREGHKNNGDRSQPIRVIINSTRHNVRSDNMAGEAYTANDCQFDIADHVQFPPITVSQTDVVNHPMESTSSVSVHSDVHPTCSRDLLSSSVSAAVTSPGAFSISKQLQPTSMTGSSDIVSVAGTEGRPTLPSRS
jgi:hypothetical protein